MVGLRIVAVVQARMGSSRLPGKVLADVHHRPLLWYVVHRTQLARCVDAVVVATPDAPEDRAIHTLCGAWNVPCVAVGPAENVVGRYLAVAETFDADAVVRITADCPLIDPRLIDLVVWSGLQQQAIYSSNVFPVRTFPDGLDVEVLTRSAVLALDQYATAPADREHVTPLLQRSLRLDQLTCTRREPSLGHLRWTVDTEADLTFIREVYRRMAPRWDFGWHELDFTQRGTGVALKNLSDWNYADSVAGTRST